MRTLAIDSATEACSVALYEDDALLAGAYEVLGRGHAERLVPMIAELPERGRAERILVSLGPGSFTGVRIGLAAARALALVWRAEVLGYPTLPLVAAMARERHPGAITVCMTGGHGEWFVQDFDPDGMPEGEVLSLRPEQAASPARHPVIAGSQSRALGSTREKATTLDILPDARCVPLLSAGVLVPSPAPIYGRPPDARLPA